VRIQNEIKDTCENPGIARRAKAACDATAIEGAKAAAGQKSERENRATKGRMKKRREGEKDARV
jgi:hypothetical protein